MWLLYKLKSIAISHFLVILAFYNLYNQYNLKTKTINIEMVIERYMTKTTLIVTDKNFRITIPEELRIAEEINQGDIIEIDVKNIGKPKEWDCRDDILTKADGDYVKTNSKCFGKNAIITLKPVSTRQRINVNRMKLTIKDADNNEISDDTILILRKGDETIGKSSEVGKYTYGDLKREVTLQKKASLSYYETLAIYLKEDVGKENNPETIIFYVDSCEKQDDIVGKHFNMK